MWDVLHLFGIDEFSGGLVEGVVVQGQVVDVLGRVAILGRVEGLGGVGFQMLVYNRVLPLIYAFLGLLQLLELTLFVHFHVVLYAPWLVLERYMLHGV